MKTTETCNCKRHLSDTRTQLVLHGFLKPEAITKLAQCEQHRLEQLLVRWHEGRALVGAQDATGLIEAAGAGGWCIRDVSFPAASDFGNAVALAQTASALGLGSV